MNKESIASNGGGKRAGRYANYFKVGHNDVEFVLDFGQFYPDDDNAQIHTRIITNPGCAKVLYNDFFYGNLRITSETGALAFYRYEKRKKERYSREKRLLIYKRNFYYGPAKAPPNMPVNKDFHRLFLNFVKSVTKFYRDQRISEVIRIGASELESSFGSIEAVRKSGIDLKR